MSWHRGRMAAFDVESTGRDAETAQIVTAAVVRVGAGHATFTRSWVLDPGVDIPAEASAIHGVTTAYAREHGMRAEVGVELICEELAAALSEGLPLVVFNAPYDFTVLDRECRRYDLPTLSARLGDSGYDDDVIQPVLDPLVLDKHCDRFRKGTRRLENVCQHYGVRLHGAHDCGWDALAAARLVTAIGDAYPEIADAPLGEVHHLQAAARAEQAASLQDYLRRKDPDAVVDPHWPLVPLVEAVAS